MWPIATYIARNVVGAEMCLRMSALRTPRANVPARREGWQDKTTAMRLLPNYVLRLLTVVSLFETPKKICCCVLLIIYQRFAAHSTNIVMTWYPVKTPCTRKWLESTDLQLNSAEVLLTDSRRTLKLAGISIGTEHALFNKATSINRWSWWKVLWINHFTLGTEAK